MREKRNDAGLCPLSGKEKEKCDRSSVSRGDRLSRFRPRRLPRADRSRPIDGTRAFPFSARDKSDEEKSARRKGEGVLTRIRNRFRYELSLFLRSQRERVTYTRANADCCHARASVPARVYVCACARAVLEGAGRCTRMQPLDAARGEGCSAARGWKGSGCIE